MIDDAILPHQLSASVVTTLHPSPSSFGEPRDEATKDGDCSVSRDWTSQRNGIRRLSGDSQWAVHGGSLKPQHGAGHA